MNKAKLIIVQLSVVATFLLYWQMLGYMYVCEDLFIVPPIAGTDEKHTYFYPMCAMMYTG